MSRLLISRSPDLLRLRGEGFSVRLVDAHAVVEDVPYLDADGQLRRGALISALALRDDEVVEPDDHTVFFSGEMPHDAHGRMGWLLADPECRGSLSDGTTYQYRFSQKPSGKMYANYYLKFRRYLGLLEQSVQASFPGASAATWQPVDGDPAESVFILEDTWSPRARISGIVNRLKSMNVAIVGVGGTGSHVLDLIAKTPCREIHLFDGKTILQRNILRLPGATDRATVKSGPNKANHYAGIYGALRRGIVPHPFALDAANIEALRGMDFVFLCVDKPAARGLIAQWLHREGIAFVDVGMGLNLTDDDKLVGMVRTSLVLPGQLDVADLPVSDVDLGDDLYNTNVQTVELNSLNAALAVIAWKKYCGIYGQVKQAPQSLYVVSANRIQNRVAN